MYYEGCGGMLQNSEERDWLHFEHIEGSMMLQNIRGVDDAP